MKGYLNIYRNPPNPPLEKGATLERERKVGIAHHRRPSSIVGKCSRAGTRRPSPWLRRAGKLRPYKISPFGKGLRLRFQPVGLTGRRVEPTPRRGDTGGFFWPARRPALLCDLCVLCGEIQRLEKRYALCDWIPARRDLGLALRIRFPELD